MQNNYKIIDIHAHIFPGKIREKAVASIGDFYDIPMDGVGSSEDLIKEGKKIETQHYIVHSVATSPKQVKSINDFIKMQCDKHKEFIGFATLHPGMEDVAEEITRIKGFGFKGIKLHPDFQAFDIDAPEAKKIYAAVGGTLPILVHMGDKTRDFSAPHRLAQMLEEFPEQVFIAAHFGGYQKWDEAEACIIGKNVYIDTSSALFCLEKERAVRLIRTHGIDKVLFGVDYPMWLHEEELARFFALELTEEENRKILYENAARLLHIKE
ncbi:MAG: amidohydrolase family protein [Christensenellaceae bacterium]|jgi:predicted TIM-barrel fold metal-dependent hydrolase